MMMQTITNTGNRGRIEHEGKTYILETDAEPTSRQITERPVEDNFFEMSATAKRLTGQQTSGLLGVRGQRRGNIRKL